MNYVITLHSKIDAKDEEEAKVKALAQIQVREATPLVVLPINAYECVKEYRDKKKEYFITILLNTQNEIIRTEIISVGTLNASLIHPREVFEPAIRHLASHVLLCHNHPSGSLEPSNEDLTVTKRLSDSGRLLGIEVIDHLLFTSTGFFSFREHHLL